MHLKFLAISDTHLGEDCSLLSFPHGRQLLCRELRRAFSDGLKQVFHGNANIMMCGVVLNPLLNT